MSLRFRTSYCVLEKSESIEEIAVMLTVETREKSLEKRNPVDIVSGSMAGSPFRLVQDTMDFFIAQLNGNDTMNDQGKRRASISCERMKTGRTTNIGAGLQKGVEELSKRKKRGSDRSASLLLFSDGRPNVGHTSVKDLVKLIPKDNHLDYTVNTFGFSKDHDAEMLTEIAAAGGGNYFYIEKSEDITQSFANVLAGVLSVVATNVEIHVEVQHTTKVSVETMYRGGSVGVEKRVSNFQLGEKKHHVVKVKKPRGVEMENLLAFKVTYSDLATVQERVKVDVVVSVDDLEEDSTSLLEIDMQMNRLLATSALDRAIGSKEQKEKVLKEAIFAIESSVSGNTPSSKSLVSDLRGCLGSSATDHVLYSVREAHHSERSTNYKSRVYKTAAREHLISKMKHREKFKHCHNCGAKDHFARSCTRAQMCHNCKRSGHVTANCPLAEKCHCCGLSGHLQANCPNSTCFKCGGKGHRASECSVKLKNSGGGGGGLDQKCFKCGEVGHRSFDCSLSRDVCYVCKEPGHISRDCPKKKKKRGMRKGNSGRGSGRRMGSRGKGSCFKCGEMGHKKFECPN